MKNILAVLCFFLALTKLSSQVSLLKDINIDSASSEVNAIFKADGFAYFKYKNASGLYNIMKTDGTVREKVLPYDVEVITQAVYGEGLVYFSDGTHLWVADGTPGGFREILFYGVPPTSIHSFAYSGGTLWFSGNNGGDSELYWCDSYFAGEIEINPLSSSSPSGLTDFNGTLYFMADDGVNGFELFKAEHLSPVDYSVTLVKDIFPGDNGSYPTWFCVWNNILYFSANDGVNGKELWKSNGTTAGTVMVADIFPGEDGSEPTGLTGLGGSIVLFTADNGTSGFELWKTNGTAAGTTLIKDICTGSNGSYPSRLTLVGGTVYFTAFEPNTGNELWKTNGTATATVLVKDIELGPASSSPKNFTAGTTHIYFSATTSATGREVYSSTGTAPTTKLMADIGPGNLDGSSKADAWLSLGNTLFFPARSPAIGKELWKSNGTTAGTTLFQDCLNSDSYPSGFTKSGGVLFFSAGTDSLGGELWKTNGTEAGTVLVKDIYPGHGSANPQNFTDLNGLLIFSANSPGHSYEIWASDGTTAGTIELKDIGDGWGGSKPRNLKKIGNSVYFSARTTTTGFELFKTDGTSNGTVMVKDINQGQDDSNPSELYEIGGGISLFMATTATQGRELWKTDGTAAGTVLVKNIGPFSGIGYAYSDGAVLNGIFYFKASNGTEGNELWRSDGTEAGTYMVKDINAGEPSSAPFSFTTMGNSVYFVAFTPSKGNEVWKTDGTAAGTVMLKDISVGSSGSIEENPELFQNVFTVVSGNLYFSAKNLATGYELWKSDGTAAGTIRIKDINPGLQNSSPYALGTTSNLLLFSAYDPSFGDELWQSDGTVNGTFMVQDIYGGDVSSVSSSVSSKGAVLDNKFIFGGQNNFNGFEVLAYTLPAGATLVSADDQTAEAKQVSAPAQDQIFKVYPNPANEVVYLEFFEKTAGEMQVSILDIAGKMFSQQTVSNADNVEINVAGLPIGVYLVQVSNADRQESRKMVVQR
ncbi:MAG TPA: T9SS type A sorting domain-containing protein [Saprospiraceae bacterium]|nr:T9SS type A sorting domain-containing protein [Saprospiraceae bacterium]